MAIEDVAWRGADGVWLSGSRWEPAEWHAPWVVLLHGGFQTRASWRSAAEHLAERGYGVVTYDLRGHGDSGRSPDGDYGFATHATDLTRLLARLDGPAALIGASLGGAIGLTLASQGDASVAALVLVDLVPRLARGGRDRIREFMTAYPDGFDSLEQASALISEYLGTPARKPRSGMARNLRRRADGRFQWHWDPAVLSGSFDTYDDAAVEEQLAAARRITAPVLVLRGEHSDVVTEEGVREFREAVPTSRYEVVPGVGHMVAAVANNPYLDAAIAFLDDVLPAPVGAGSSG